MMRITLSMVFMILATATYAAQTVTVLPDGTIKIAASLKGVTRVAINGDRIRRFVNDGSLFEMVNDEETGDAFLRYVGGEAFEPETGFIITEGGVTINYQIRASRTASEAVLVTIKGGPKEQKAAEAEETFASGVTAGAGESYDGDLATFVRRVIQEKVGRRRPGSKSGNGVVATVRDGAWRAKVMVVRAGATGGQVSHQTYFKPGVLAVWVDTPILGPKAATFVVVVEGK